MANIEITFTPLVTGVIQPITAAKGAQTKVITGLINGTLYTFSVKAVYAAGNKSETASITATPSAASVAVTGVNLSKNTLSLIVGGTATLTAAVTPANAGNTGVTWSSSNNGTATVSGGVVTAVAAGTATITVTTADGGYTIVCAVTVNSVTNPNLPSYTITYNLNNGTNPTGAPTSYTNEDTVILPTPARNGYDFGGWYASSGLSGTAVTQIAVGSTGAKEFWAKWTATPYTITYNLDNGTNPAGAPTSYTIESAVTLPMPTRNGYDFGGWYGNSGLSGMAVTQITANSTGAKEFWAKWEPTTSLNVTIGFNYGQITVSGTGGNLVLSKTGAQDRPASITFSIDADASYSAVKWYVDGSTSAVGTGGSLTMQAGGLTAQRHSVTFTGWKGGMFYSSDPITFTVLD
ncbi:hypothetical protein AGMMS49991_01950 [Spirochaetia bacterium]|nr:hypothetical protein AGMMS49991_01950 [Spirochaetia bacterium]